MQIKEGSRASRLVGNKLTITWTWTHTTADSTRYWRTSQPQARASRDYTCPRPSVPRSNHWRRYRWAWRSNTGPSIRWIRSTLRWACVWRRYASGCLCSPSSCHCWLKKNEWWFRFVRSNERGRNIQVNRTDMSLSCLWFRTSFFKRLNILTLNTLEERAHILFVQIYSYHFYSFVYAFNDLVAYPFDVKVILYQSNFDILTLSHSSFPWPSWYSQEAPSTFEHTHNQWRKRE